MELDQHPRRGAHDRRPDTKMQERAEYRKRGRIEWNQSEQGEDVRWVRHRKVVDPAEERGMPHLDRNEQHLVERILHDKLDHDVKTPGHWLARLALAEQSCRLALCHDGIRPVGERE